MTTKDLSHIPTNELLKDRLKSIQDRDFCQWALNLVTIWMYWAKGPKNLIAKLKARIDGNEKIIETIDEELAKRTQSIGYKICEALGLTDRGIYVGHISIDLPPQEPAIITMDIVDWGNKLDKIDWGELFPKSEVTVIIHRDEEEYQVL